MQRIPPPMTFSTLQVLSDLHSAALSGFAGLSQALTPDIEPVLRRVVFEQECRMTAEDAEALHAELMMMASMPDQDHANFMTATIILLADRLHFGAGEDDLYWNWDAFRDRYREAPSPLRAAVMNGFRCAHGMGLVKLGQLPRGVDLRTYDEDDLIRLLRIIARSMTDTLRDQVCALAPKEIRMVHRHALDNCLRSSCILSEFGGWFPSEVVEEASLDSAHPAYAACTALMILDAIATRDAAGKMALRYEHQADDYNLLGPELRVPLLAGLRHLHEMGADWEPYGDWSPEMRIDKAIVMPFPKA